MAAYFAARLTDALRSQMQARREADAILRVAFEGLAAGLEVVDRGKVVAQNLQAERLFGARAGDRWRCPGHRGPACDAAEIGCGARPERCQFAVHAPTEPERIFEMLAFPLPGNDRVMALYVDRTSEVLSQRQLMLTERLASLGRTVQGVAHELNTPLATILTLGRDVNDALAEAELPDAVRDDVTESTGMIISEVQRCRRITHALLGRAEHFDARTGGADASVAQAMDRAVAVVFTQDRAQVEVQLGPIAEARFPLDPLVQIFVNLLQNARDAAPEAPIVVRGRQEGGLAVEIEDHGPGLPPEAERHLFEPFFTTKPPGRGTGLGLYTSYALARGLRAELTLRNRPEGGAVATLRLPGSLSDPSTSAAASA
ncbi:MAG: hypothetical protein KC620_11995 [Myxococcales bacterium]|nr:hypothetical protein [Myxococcales bacterium]